MQKLLWRVKLISDLGDGSTGEIEVAQIERDAWTVPETVGLSPAESKKLAAAVQTEMVRVCVTFRACRSFLPKRSPASKLQKCSVLQCSITAGYHNAIKGKLDHISLLSRHYRTAVN